MPYTYPGQNADHALTPLKGWFRETALAVEGTIGSNVNIGGVATPPCSGLVVHGVSVNANTDPYGGLFNGPGFLVFEMGCGAAQGPPIFLWPNSFDPDISNPGVIPGDPAYGTVSRPPDFISVLPKVSGQNMTGLVGLGAYELETTEFDTAQTYTVGNGLRTVTSNTDANAGKVTNQAGATAPFNSSGATVFGNPAVAAWDTIVGFVSRATYTNANRRACLAFWSAYLPGTR